MVALIWSFYCVDHICCIAFEFRRSVFVVSGEMLRRRQCFKVFFFIFNPLILFFIVSGERTWLLLLESRLINRTEWAQGVAKDFRENLIHLKRHAFTETGLNSFSL